MSLKTIRHEADFCVVGGGLAGLCAAVTAARHGAKTVLMQERPMLGGNASSEVRMWVSGARGKDNRETGLLEEIMMDNQYRNPDKVYCIWDSILYEKARKEENLTLLLNCSCMDADMNGKCIYSVTGWQMTTQQFHCVEAKVFADCSGDSILAPLTGAEYRMGREARSEYGESFGPEKADTRTMGMTCLMQAEETEREHSFIAPDWAEKITSEQLFERKPDLSRVAENYCHLELSDDEEPISGTEKLRDQLLAIDFGVWDYLKNNPEEREKNKNFMLSWIGMLPGKRESRRYVGAHVLTESDVLSGGHFDDEVAYGGWPMDDHHPGGFRVTESPTIFHRAPSPYGIPYRCLYSVSVPNLMFAGRNISVTHDAMSSSRVMGTCALLGQAVGTAASLTVKYNCLPKAIEAYHIEELQDILQADDCFLPHKHRKIPLICLKARLSGDGDDVDKLRDGIDRPRPDDDHAWKCGKGASAVYRFMIPQKLHSIRIVFDSDLNRETLPTPECDLARNMFHNRLLCYQPSVVPPSMVRAFRIIAVDADCCRKVLVDEKNNYHRLYRCEVSAEGCTELILEIIDTWGFDWTRVFAFEAE